MIHLDRTGVASRRSCGISDVGHVLPLLTNLLGCGSEIPVPSINQYVHAGSCIRTHVLNLRESAISHGFGANMKGSAIKDGMGRSVEQARRDDKWCVKVARFLK